MAMRVVAIAIVLGLGAYVYITKEQADNPAAPAKVDQGDKFYDPDVQGVEPDSPPEPRVAVELIREGKKATLQFTVTEAHGWYMDHLYVEFWYQEKGEDGEYHQLGNPIPYMFHHYLGFGQTLTEKTVVLDIEFPEVKDWGTTENWKARISSYKKVLAPKR